MNTKLTITLDPVVIGKAKQYARQNGRSLSNLIEDYLRALTNESTPSPQSKQVEPTSKARRLYGILENLGKDVDTGALLEEAMIKKYL